MAKRTLDKETRFARLIRIWEYLRRNTYRDHPITQEAIRQDPEIRDYLGDKLLMSDIHGCLGGGFEDAFR